MSTQSEAEFSEFENQRNSSITVHAFRLNGLSENSLILKILLLTYCMGTRAVEIDLTYSVGRRVEKAENAEGQKSGRKFN